MQAVRGAVEADIGGDRRRLHGGRKRLGVGALEYKTPSGGFVEETVGRHGGELVGLQATRGSRESASGRRALCRTAGVIIERSEGKCRERLA